MALMSTWAISCSPMRSCITLYGTEGLRGWQHGASSFKCAEFVFCFFFFLYTTFIRLEFRPYKRIWISILTLRCSQLLQRYRSDQRHSEVGWVWFLEADARFQQTAAQVQGLMSSLPKSSNIGGPGYRNIWAEGTKVEWYYGMKQALEGSQAIVFRKDGLRQAFAATSAGTRYRHFDLMLSERLAGKFWFPFAHAVRTASHPSIIYGKGKSVVRPGTVLRRPAATTEKPVKKPSMKNIYCNGIK